MHNRTEQALRSTWRGASGRLSELKQPSVSECPTVELFTSIHQLPLYRFESCLCDNDLDALIIEGNVPRETLASAWSVIYEQFLDGMKDKEGMHRVKLMGKINHLEFTYNFCRLCIKFLSSAYDKEVVDMLSRHIRVNLTYNPEDLEGYFKSLQVLINTTQQILVQIENKKAEHAALGGVKTGEKATRQQFDRLVTQVSLFAKFHIDRKTVTVSEFITYYLSMREHRDALEAAKNRK